MSTGQPEQSSLTTGDARVDEAVTRLSALAGLPVTDQLAVFEEVDRRLRAALTEAPAPPGPAGPATPAGDG